MHTVTRLSPFDRRVAEALGLAGEVFLEFDAPLFPEYGRESFLRFLRGNKLKLSLLLGRGAMYICTVDKELAGMAAVINLYNKKEIHLSLAFVKGKFHRRGIGRALLSRIISDFPRRNITVNAAPAGYEFYKAMGFIPSAMEGMRDGLIFTPMRLDTRG